MAAAGFDVFLWLSLLFVGTFVKPGIEEATIYICLTVTRYGLETIVPSAVALVQRQLESRKRNRKQDASSFELDGLDPVSRDVVARRVLGSKTWASYPSLHVLRD